MLHKTFNTYEAAWYILNGGKFVDVEFRRVACKPGQFLTKTIWLITVDLPEEKFAVFWKLNRPIGNIKLFAKTRITLKNEIEKIKCQKSPLSP